MKIVNQVRNEVESEAGRMELNSVNCEHVSV